MLLLDKRSIDKTRCIKLLFVPVENFTQRPLGRNESKTRSSCASTARDPGTCRRFSTVSDASHGYTRWGLYLISDRAALKYPNVMQLQQGCATRESSRMLRNQRNSTQSLRTKVNTRKFYGRQRPIHTFFLHFVCYALRN